MRAALFTKQAAMGRGGRSLSSCNLVGDSSSSKRNTAEASTLLTAPFLFDNQREEGGLSVASARPFSAGYLPPEKPA